MENCHLLNFQEGNIYLNSFSNIRSLDEEKRNELIGDTAEGITTNTAGLIFEYPGATGRIQWNTQSTKDKIA